MIHTGKESVFTDMQPIKKAGQKKKGKREKERKKDKSGTIFFFGQKMMSGFLLIIPEPLWHSYYDFVLR